MYKPKTCAAELSTHADEVRRIQRDDLHPDHHFYSLVRPYEREKKRKCLRCQQPFRSSHRGTRVCSVCQNIKVGALGTFRL